MDIRSDLLIRADLDRVWDLTVDVERWPELGPTMTSVTRLDDGPLRVGSTARVVQPFQRPTVWTVTHLEPQRFFEWFAKVGTITMTARHRLVPEADGVRNELSVEFSGFGSRLVRRLIGSKIREAITIENEGFRRLAESADHVATDAPTVVPAVAPTAAPADTTVEAAAGDRRAARL
jgi:hypothetical protein